MIQAVPPPALVSLLAGYPSPTHQYPEVRSALSAGESPGRTLECLRLSAMEPDALMDFASYVAWRSACKDHDQLSPQQRAAQPVPPGPNDRDALMLKTHEALYDLAVNAGNMPRLRLIILDARPFKYMEAPQRVQDDHVDRTGQELDFDMAFWDRPIEEGKQTTRLQSPWFRAALRKAAAKSRNRLEDDVEDAFAWSQDDEDWQDRLWDCDNAWRLVKAGKEAFKQLWSSSRARSAEGGPGHEGVGETSLPVETEIRVVARKYDDLCSIDEERADFYSEFEQLRSAKSGGEGFDTSVLQDTLPQTSSPSATAPAQDVGIWTDQDVFSLVNTMPWLSYRMDSAGEFCYWTGELPRESIVDVTAGPSHRGRTIRTVIPSIVSLADSALDEQGRWELQQLQDSSDDDDDSLGRMQRAADQDDLSEGKSSADPSDRRKRQRRADS